MTKPDFTALEAVLGHRFQQPELLHRALTHSSHAREAESLSEEEAGTFRVLDNEQLEFLGDAVLGFVTSEELFRRFPHYDEGHLSKFRAHLVSEKHLTQVAASLELGRFLVLGRGEEKSGGRAKSALLANALEAILAALYLDAGLEQARKFILQHILLRELTIYEAHEPGQVPITDYKSALQELVHTTGHAPPSYILVKEEGPEHKKTFTVEGRLHRSGKIEFVARAAGPTKKRAEQNAARLALEYLWSLPQATPPNQKSKRTGRSQ